MNKPNVVWLSLLSPDKAQRKLEGFEERREGVTVFCGERSSFPWAFRRRATRDFPWAVGGGEVAKEDILHEYSAGSIRSYGGWWDEEGQTYLWESVTLFSAREDALLAAELRGEKCIFDTSTGEEVWL